MNVTTGIAITDGALNIAAPGKAPGIAAVAFNNNACCLREQAQAFAVSL